MNKEQYSQYLESDHWKSLRRIKLEQSNYKCDRCGSAYYLQVHHLNYRQIYNVLLTDLQTLCRYCHEREHGIVSGFRPINPDVKSLLKDCYNTPLPKPPKAKLINGMNQEEIRRIIANNKAIMSAKSGKRKARRAALRDDAALEERRKARIEKYLQGPPVILGLTSA